MRLRECPASCFRASEFHRSPLQLAASKSIASPTDWGHLKRMDLPLFTVNAFAERPFTGNPAAVCPLDQWLDDALLQAIAAQNNLAETAFIVDAGDGSYHIRWFSPTVEVPLCGHATLAAAFALRTELGESRDRIDFRSRSGPLHVTCAGELYTLNFPAQPASPCPTPDWFTSAFGANPAEFYKASFFMAVFPSENIVAALEPDFGLLERVPNAAIIATAPGDRCDFVSRFFAPAFGVNEDPVTGAAHCTLIPYWSRRLRKTDLDARQISRRGGSLHCAIKGDRVHIAGRAKLYSRATIYV